MGWLWVESHVVGESFGAYEQLVIHVARGGGGGGGLKGV